jgi:hypothetical protein
LTKMQSGRLHHKHPHTLWSWDLGFRGMPRNDAVALCRWLIVVDPNWTTSEAATIEILRHESCHVATWEVMDPTNI